MFDIPQLNNLFISFLKLHISLIELKTFLYLITYLFLFLSGPYTIHLIEIN